jgi:hypothetical protein
VEYPFELDACPECDGSLTDAPAPERRASLIEEPGYVVLTTLPGDQALVAAGRLDADGIPNALRDATTGVETLDGSVDVLVLGPHVSIARDVLRGRRKSARRSAHRRPMFLMYVLLALSTALLLSASLFVARWLLTGSPVPR